MVGGPKLPPSYFNVCKIRRLCRVISSLVFDKSHSNLRQLSVLILRRVLSSRVDVFSLTIEVEETFVLTD